MTSPPVESDFDIVLDMRHLDAPEVLGYESLDAKVTIDNKSECGKLTGPLLSISA